jgi:hypothetical protein
MSNIRSFLAIVVICLLTQPAFAQQGLADQRLRIIPLEGDNVTNYIRIRSATAPIVEVRDENDRPLEGVTVVFKLPTTGPGAAFEGGQGVQTRITDARGQAGTTGYVTNDVLGPFTIEVTATLQNRTGRLLMRQINSADPLPPELGGAPKKSSKKKWIIFSVVAAAAATAAIVYLTVSGSDGPISVGSGPISVGGPR